MFYRMDSWSKETKKWEYSNLQRYDQLSGWFQSDIDIGQIDWARKNNTILQMWLNTSSCERKKLKIFFFAPLHFLTSPEKSLDQRFPTWGTWEISRGTPNFHQLKILKKMQYKMWQLTKGYYVSFLFSV